MSSKILLEVCIESTHSALAASQGGADRIELNTALALGGLTPTTNLLNQIKQSVSLPIICMVRPRPGDFHYSHTEFRLMLDEARSLLAAGADGLAIGCLNEMGEVDSSRVRQLREICASRELVFHRACDCSPDLDATIELLVDLGIDRVLTSGGAHTAVEGQTKIADLQAKYGDRIEILPGSGLNNSNIGDFLKATGCRQIHGTFRTVVATGSEYRSPINFNEIMNLDSNQKYESSMEQIELVSEVCRRSST